MRALFILGLFTFSAFGAPRELEVWFLSNAKVTELIRLINQPPYVLYTHTAKMECQEMGDYCFDPQHGLYKKEDALEAVNIDKAIVDNGPSIPSGHSVDRDLINCDPKNYFDIFCGKAKKTAGGNAKLDLWIDTSSSMREFDFVDKEGGCYRKSFMKRLDDFCPFNHKVNVMMFDTSLKEVGTMDTLCVNQGLNDYKRLMDWVERSEAHKLVIITDIYEFNKEFSDFVESKNGRLKGDRNALTAKELLGLVDELAKSCK